MTIEPVNWNGQWVWITNKYGRFLSFNNSISNIAYEQLAYQDEISKALEKGQYDIFIDVGAYIGFFSIIGNHFCKEVIAYEASPFFYGILLFNTQKLYNVKCKYVWIANKNSKSCLVNAPDMVSIVPNGISYQYNIPILTLDDELFEIVKYKKAFIKIDIEGSELEALEGASKLLQLPNIDWYIDVHVQSGIKVNDILNFFKNRKKTSISNVIYVRDDIK